MEKTELKCIKCNSLNFVKNGFVFGVQRYKCQSCGYQFTKASPMGKSIFIKLMTHTLYLSGLKMREIAPIVGVTAQSVSRWIRKWHLAYMNDVGNKTKIQKIKAKNLCNYLDLNEDDNLMIVSVKLPSGSKCYSVIQLPHEKESPLIK